MTSDIISIYIRLISNLLLLLIIYTLFVVIFRHSYDSTPRFDYFNSIPNFPHTMFLLFLFLSFRHITENCDCVHKAIQSMPSVSTVECLHGIRLGDMFEVFPPFNSHSIQFGNEHHMFDILWDYNNLERLLEHAILSN